jgi:hypothetical protein
MHWHDEAQCCGLGLDLDSVPTADAICYEMCSCIDMRRIQYCGFFAMLKGTGPY